MPNSSDVAHMHARALLSNAKSMQRANHKANLYHFLAHLPFIKFSMLAKERAASLKYDRYLEMARYNASRIEETAAGMRIDNAKLRKILNLP